jgi:hypothetical protein
VAGISSGTVGLLEGGSLDRDGVPKPHLGELVERPPARMPDDAHRRLDELLVRAAVPAVAPPEPHGAVNVVRAGAVERDAPVHLVGVAVAGDAEAVPRRAAPTP